MKKSFIALSLALLSTSAVSQTFDQWLKHETSIEARANVAVRSVIFNNPSELSVNQFVNVGYGIELENCAMDKDCTTKVIKKYEDALMSLMTYKDRTEVFSTKEIANLKVAFDDHLAKLSTQARLEGKQSADKALQNHFIRIRDKQKAAEMPVVKLRKYLFSKVLESDDLKIESLDGFTYEIDFTKIKAISSNYFSLELNGFSDFVIGYNSENTKFTVDGQLVSYNQKLELDHIKHFTNLRTFSYANKLPVAILKDGKYIASTDAFSIASMTK